MSRSTDSNASNRWTVSLKPGGMRTPPDPPDDNNAFAVVSHYVGWYEKEYARIREFSKARVSRVITLIAALNAGIAILGVASAAWKYPWFGLASTALAGIAGILTARNNLFRDQELWQLRSSTLSRLQQLKREMQYRKASGEESVQLSCDTLAQLNELLDGDLRGWSGVSRSGVIVPQGGESSQSQVASNS